MIHRDNDNYHGIIYHLASKCSNISNIRQALTVNQTPPAKAYMKDAGNVHKFFATLHAHLDFAWWMGSLIREYGSTLYVGLARALSPTNTNFRLTFLLTRLQEAPYEDLAV